jgi:hypothetical protein
MITLYYHRGACSTSNHFALEEARIEYEAIDRRRRVLSIAIRKKLFGSLTIDACRLPSSGAERV